MEWLWTGAAIGGVAAAWSYIRGIFQQILGLVFVTATYDMEAAKPLTWYLREHGRRLWSPSSRYTGYWTWVAKHNRRELVIQKYPGSVTTWYWVKGQLLFANWQGAASNVDSPTIHLTGLRWLTDFDQLTLEAAKPRVQQRASRFYVRDFYDPSGDVSVRPQGFGGNQVFNAQPPQNSDFVIEQQYSTFVTHELSDFEEQGRDSSMDDYSLSPTSQQALDDAKAWLEDQQWHMDRNIPWRLGQLYKGPPGTGKTAFLLNMAKQLDLPLGVVHLNGMTDRGLEHVWQELSAMAPCIALIEDLDATFELRTNISAQSASMGMMSSSRTVLSFAALLNVIDGVNTPPGILLAITTNRPEVLDPALAGDGEQTRPGRIDYVYLFDALPEAARQHMAKRILADFSEEDRQALVDAHREVSGAAFQHVCRQAAKERRKNGVSSVR